MIPVNYQLSTESINHVADICFNLGRWLQVLKNNDEEQYFEQFKRHQLVQKVNASIGMEESSSDLSGILLSGIYEQIPDWDLASKSDLKKAHHSACMPISSVAGCYRSAGMGVYRQNKLVHMTAPAGNIRKQLPALLSWLEVGDEHPLIKAAVFMQQYEYIQPFSIANGCIGRCWMTLILSRWHPLLAWLNIEEVFKFNRERYFECLKSSISDNNIESMVEFILECIRTVVKKTVDSELLAISREYGSGISSEKSSDNGSEFKAKSHLSTRMQVLSLLNENPEWSAASVADYLNISSRAVEKHISKLKGQSLLIRKGSARGGYWRVTTEIEEQLSLPADWS